MDVLNGLKTAAHRHLKKLTAFSQSRVEGVAILEHIELALI
ncbi:16348_t:CDS:2 [Entrophospora sp. SA101]|nr:5999_t:CDS:2 [Entrophospora sp. SA101]CAJ0636652.1 16348_t:CDS:2 [Entrophospora sp. SA101]CAJ0845599.1 13869_t:CDS:2 [Entrophospora sp. SA101]